MKKVRIYLENFKKTHPFYKNLIMPPHFHFCDNQKDADECAELVVKGIKQATSPSLWWFEKNNEPLPEKGDLSIITDWVGNPKAIVQTEKVEIVKFKDISPAYAKIEGEGDQTLRYWKETHWKYYQREMEKENLAPNEEMEIVCEFFKTIYNG